MTGPFSGISVVEVATGTTDLGLGLAGGVPGMILAHLGAGVDRVVDARPAPIDASLHWGRVWHRGKTVIPAQDPGTARELLGRADVALVYGPEELVEQAGLGWRDTARDNPDIVYARCRPSRTSRGTVDDFCFLVEARSGFCTQLPGHRPGPTFVDVRAAGSGAAFLMTASVLALLRQRCLTGAGGWAETSLYDGMLATLGCMVGRSERAAPEIERYWEKGSWFPNFLYRCADGALIQVWFGGKGMYDRLIDVLGDEPSTDGYYADQAAGRLNDRAARWRQAFATEPREVWIQRLRAEGVACEPVLGPGEALDDPHLTDTGLALRVDDGGHENVVVGTPIRVRPLGGPISAAPPPAPGQNGLLEGLRVVDFSAFVAGPLASQILADLGAEVIKVEPPGGEAMRGAAYALAACQRGKRSLAIDLAAAEARPVVEALLRSADVVLHNFRVGVAERLGIDEATASRLNPGVVYCHASAFGSSGPRARFPGNDALMQALTGFEQAVGGEGNDPLAATWIPIDMSGGWTAAIAILSGLYARASTGAGQGVETSLLGAGMLLQSGVFRRDGSLVPGPRLDARQTGYGPGYRMYETGDGRWLALVVTDPAGWEQLRSLPGAEDLPSSYVPLRVGSEAARAAQAEAVLEAVFRSSPASEWLQRFQGGGVRAELVETPDRDGFRRGILDDPVNRQLGRVISFPTADWGRFEQIGPLLRSGPSPPGKPAFMFPGVGEHTEEVLSDLGFSRQEVDHLLDAKVVRQL